MEQDKTDLPLFKKFGTDAIHAGQSYDGFSGAVISPISLSTTFAQKSPGEFYPGHFEYARTGNPTRNSFEECVASLENAKYGAAFASGLAATATLLHLFKKGDHIITIDDVYGGTGRYFQKIATNNGFEFSFIDLSDESLLEKEIRKETKLLWIETPTNPTLKIVDIKKLSEIAHQHKLIVVVDNTFMSPYFQRPLDFGADIVLHSISKYINGHSDVIGGIVCLNDDEIYKQIKFLQNGMGAILSPFDSFLAMRGVKTLHVRMQRHASNAMAVAKFLDKHPKIEKVTYPGLPSHPQHHIAKTQMTGYGGMITIFLKGGLKESKIFLENLKIFALAESLGGVESLAEHPAIMTHASVPTERRRLLGIGDNMCRLSIGIEELEDILGDLSNALDKI